MQDLKERGAATAEEQRAAPRLRVLKGAKIIFHNRSSVLDCTVRNMSKSGCLVLMPDTTPVPDSFTLQTLPEKAERACEVAWRNKDQMGVRFVG